MTTDEAYKMDKYYIRQENLFRLFDRSNQIKVKILGFGEIAFLTVSLRLSVPAKTEGKIPLIEMWSEWSPQKTKLNLDNKRIIDIWELKVIEPEKLELSIVYDRGTVIYADSSKLIKNRDIVISFSFKSVGLIRSLREPEPYNRFLLSFVCRLGELADRKTCVRLDRPATALTRFTKGNYALAMPAVKLEKGLLTSVYYDNTEAKENLVFLKYAFADSDIDKETTPWIISSVGGLGVMIALGFLLADFGQKTMIEITASLIAVSATLFETFRRYLSISRYALYSKKRSYAEVSMSLVLVGIASVISSMLIKFFYPGTFGYIQSLSPIFFIYATALIMLGVIGIVGLRSGIWQKYECDMPFCDKILRLRTRTKECVPTGRVTCNSCFSTLCSTCDCAVCSRFDCGSCAGRETNVCITPFQDLRK